MNKLEEVKNHQLKYKFTETNDILWLIKQAEKTEELEKVNRKLNHEIGAYSGKIGSIAEKLLLMEREMLNG